ncbi:MAG: ornithine carbamoyltransferase [Candidatus Omnitrophota bacterium]
MKRNILSISDLSADEIYDIINRTKQVKKNRLRYARSLYGKCIGMVFEKPSNRTRVSFEVGMVQLGGHAVYLGPSELGMGKRESAKDVARVLSRYLDAIITRTFDHAEAEELARYATVPVVNGLSDKAHPCQALCDIFTVAEKFGAFRGVQLAYVGDGNNVLNSLMCASAKVGLNITVATPKGFEPKPYVVKQSKEFAKRSGSKVLITNDLKKAIAGADVVYTDVWVSMGQESQTTRRLKAFRPYQVNEKQLCIAKKNCFVMHCLPAHRGQEITDGVIDSARSIVYDQAENRMHTEKAILLRLLK